MSNKKSINWGIIGAGNIAKKMTAAIAQIPDAKLVAVASKSLERAKSFAEKNNI
ncbi:hypothetical protein fh0823_14510 [Francisella halioticida]|nr:Gfo/Idh/MocA family oxidoreductase [Francisella halioticida]BCD91312.1 hypothetical protein fh0823_14510 [Francisella halioticida]